MEFVSLCILIISQGLDFHAELKAMLALVFSAQYRCGIHRWDSCIRAYQKYVGCKFGSGAEYSMER